MKKICKSLLLTLLAVALMFNTFGIVLADATTASIAVREEALEGGVSKLVFKVTTPAGADGVSMMNIVFSYDESKVQLIDSYDATTEVTSADLDYAFATIDQGRIALTPSVLSASANGRTAVAVSVSAPAAKFFDATAGADVLEFYFKIKDGKEADSETFTLEKDITDGSFIAGFYPTASNRIPAFISTITVSGGVSSPSEQYKYVGGASDTLAAPTFTYTGSDKKVFKEVTFEIEGDSTTIAAPTKYPAEPAKRIKITATAWATDGSEMEGYLDNFSWGTYTSGDDIALNNYAVVDLVENNQALPKNQAVLVIKPGCPAGTVTVNGTNGSYEKRQSFTITREDVVPATIVSKAGGVEIVNDALTVVKPATATSAAKTVAFTAKVYDQYGGEIDTAATPVAFSTADEQTGVTFADNTLTVTNEAADGTVIITAAYGSLTKNIAVSIVGLEVNWSEVTVADEITYGDTNASAVTLPTDNKGTATVDGATVNGVYSVVDADAKQNAGPATVTVKFTANADEGDYADVAIEETYDITINKADYDMTRISAAPQTSTYTGSAIDYVDSNVSAPIDVTILNKVYSASPVNVGEYTVTISFETTDTNYNNPTDVIADLAIEKATATAFVTEAPEGTATAKDIYEYDIHDAAALKADITAEGLLPATAVVSYGDSLTAEVAMTWADATQAFDPKGGVYTYVGTPSNGNLDLGTLTLTATLNISAVNGVLTEGLNNITVAQEALATADSYDDIKFPASIEVTYGDDAAATVIDSLTWTKTLEELKAVAVGSSVTVGLAADTFPVWATITNANDFTFSVTDKLPVDIEITMAAAGVYGTAMEAATADQVDTGDGIDESGTEDIDIVYTGTTANGEAYNSEDVPTEAGSYTVTATLVSLTHAGSATADFTIAPKAIEVTVDDATKKYSDANPTFAIVEPVDGLVGEDDLEVTFSTTATETTPVGTAPITAVAGNANYDVTFVDGTLTIERKPLSETAFVPVISGPTDRGAALSFAVAGLAADQYDAAWNGTTNGILAWADSNTAVSVTITGKNNYTGTVTSDVYVIPKYEISGTVSAAITTDAGEDGILNAGDVITVDITAIDDYADLVDAGATFTYEWKAGEETLGAEATLTLPAEKSGVLTVTVTPSENFAGSITATVGEIDKMPLAGTITILNTEGVLTADTTALAPAAEGTDFELKWFRGETEITDEVVDGTYTVTSADYGETITVKAVAIGETYSGEVVGTYAVPAIAPSNVAIATTVTADSITATVTAVENGAVISSYTIAIEGGESYTGAANSYTFEGLTTGTTYTITATATNSAGTSETATVTATAVAPSRPRPSNPTTPSTPSTPSTPDAGEGEGTGSEGEGTTTPDKEVEVKVEDTSATVDADVIKDNDSVAVTTETESGTAVTTTVNVADGNVANLEVSTTDSDKAAVGAAAEGAVGTPVEVNVDATDAEGNAVDVSANVSILSEEEVYAYIIDANGVATRTDSVYNAETGAVEVANVPDGAVVMLSTTAPATFADADDHWAEDTINYAVDAGLMNGVGGSSFDPDGLATRGMVNAMLVRLAKVAGIEIAEATDDHKVDTDADHWAAETDLIALANGWSTGVRVNEDGTVVMDTDGTVTREQLVTLLWRFVEHPEAEGDITTFDDHHETSDWAKEAKAWAVGAGIINGKPGNVLDPTGTATRSEIATMFQRLMVYMTK